MLQVTPDISKNRLYFKISGNVTKEALNKLYTDVRFCVADLEPGFDVVSDFSECKLANLNGLPTFKKIRNYLISNRVGDVIRVMPKRAMILTQLLNLASRVQGYKPTYVSTLEEAEQRLANSIRRNGIRFQLHRKTVEYTIDETEGQGNILDISISGCAVESATLLPPIDAEIMIIFSLMNQDNSAEEFNIKARVAWGKEAVFAVEFTDLGDQQKKDLWECLVYESQRD